MLVRLASDGGLSMIPGNCLICAGLIWLVHGGSVITSKRPGTKIPHWLVKCRDGSIRHFIVARDILPAPLCYVVFLGRIEKV